MNRIAIITARGGSKRIPRKNIKSFAGNPIIKYSIEAALNSNCFDEVMVSTDDNEIAEVAKKCGAKVPFFRSEKNSDDISTTVDVLLEVIEEYKKAGKVFKTICCLYPTAPFLTSQKLISVVEKFEESKADALISVVKYGFPVLRSFKIENEKLKFNFPEHEKTRSQDLPSAYHDAGQVYFIKTEVILKEKSFLTGNTIAFELDETECQDIDTEADWKLAELKFELMLRKK